MKKLGVVVLAICGCQQGATSAEVSALSSRVDRLGAAINETHAVCSGNAESAPRPVEEAPGEPAPREPRAESAEPLADPSPLAFAPTVRTGRVSATTGESGVVSGDRCTVEVWSVDDHRAPPTNCRVRVRCGAREVYGPDTGPDESGSWGWLYCSVRDGRPDDAFDGNGVNEEEDPRLRLDLSGNTVSISDEGYSIDLRLDPEASGPTGGGLRSRDPNVFAPALRYGRVSNVTGTPPGETPVARGAACVVRVWPEDASTADVPLNGRVDVECGASHLFGPDVGAEDRDNYGFVLIGVRGGEPAMAFDPSPSGETSDPQLELDLFGGTVAVADGELYRVDIALDR
jgi:hypothetical protein